MPAWWVGQCRPCNYRTACRYERLCYYGCMGRALCADPARHDRPQRARLAGAVFPGGVRLLLVSGVAADFRPALAPLPAGYDYGDYQRRLHGCLTALSEY